MHLLLSLQKMGTAPLTINTLLRPGRQLPQLCIRSRICYWRDWVMVQHRVSLGHFYARHDKSLTQKGAASVTTPYLPTTMKHYFQKRHFTSDQKLTSSSDKGSCNSSKIPHNDEEYSEDTERTSEVLDSTEDNILDDNYLGKLSMPELKDLYKNVTFHPIFQFPLIRVAGVISRLKLFQTGVTMIVLPPITYGYLAGTSPLTMLQLSYGVATLAAVVLYALSNYFRRLIGVVSISEDEKVIRVGRLTFWGNRKNLFYHVHDVVPFSDLKDSVNDVLIKFQTYNDPTLLYISIRLGTITDTDKFEKVFGSL